MHPLRCFSACLLAGLVVACNNTSSPTPVSGGGGPSADAGTTPQPDAGAPPQGDAGTPPAPDGGSGNGGSGGGSPDAGTTTTNDCNGLMPGALPTQVNYSADYPPTQFGFCGLPLGDGMGVLGFEVSQNGHPNWDLVSPSGVKQGSTGFWRGFLYDQPVGFIGRGGSSADETDNVDSVDENGNVRNNTAIRGSGISVPMPNGGMLLAGRFALGFPGGTFPQGLWRFNQDGTRRWGPVPTTQNAIFGAGADLLDHSLIVFDGGSGRIMAQWFDANGAPMTGEFELIHSFSAGRNTWFETAALIGGGVAVRRVDQPDDSNERHTSQWLAVLASGSTQVQAAPAWLTSRPNTDLKLVESGRAYATAPTAQDAASCGQNVEVLSPSGNSCATLTFTVDGSACTTRELRIGRDGTVMQMLPADREHDVTVSGVRTCTMHFWPAALR